MTDSIKNRINKLKYDNDFGFAFESALLAFEEKLAEAQIQMPPEFAELIEKHFWEMI